MSEVHGGLTPRQIVAYLDRYIVGQAEAKKAVAVALRNRVRRQALPPELAAEVTPKNILMAGPTGVGKTEIARRLAKLVGAPFVKVEATKFTEVGYVGRDVESMVRDLAEVACRMVREKLVADKTPEAREAAIERMIDFLVPGLAPKSEGGIPTFAAFLKGVAPQEPKPAAEPSHEGARGKMRRLLEEGKLDDREVEIEVAEKALDLGAEQNGVISMGDMLKDMMPRKTKRLKVKVKDGLALLQEEEAEKLVDSDYAGREGLKLAESEGIIFIDEIDKVTAAAGGRGADVSREGVQRDLLPIVEGSVVRTKWGPLATDHILFIAAGAFQTSSPSDLVPELQGRLPIRVELDSLGAEELARILVEPRHNLIEQYQALLGTEGLQLSFTDGAVKRIAVLAEEANRSEDNIGARRLHTMVERLLEDYSFAPEDYRDAPQVIDEARVDEKLASLVENSDLSRYLL